MQLQTSDAIWTAHHCGLVSLNPNVLIQPIFTSSDDGRVIYCSVVRHTTNLFPPMIIMNIYAPASSSDRYRFYTQLLSQPFFQTLLTAMSNSAHSPDYLSTVPDAPSMILGDFNYNFRRYRLPVPSTEPCIESQWLFHSMMLHYYRECTHGLGEDSMIPTFRRNTTFSTIDYSFVDPQLIEFRTDQFVYLVHSKWTDDHALLSLQLTFANHNLGKEGLWRANPALVNNEHFRTTGLMTALDEYHTNVADITPQVAWDQIKALTRPLAQSCCRRQSEWGRRLLRHLQSKRNKMLRIYKVTQVRNDRLPKIESMIGNLQQQELSDIQALLRAGIKWREQG
ncbi:hypothetical protein PS15m_002336 [Mucor circinelloides]